MKDFWHTKDAVSQIFTDECILYPIEKDPGYIEPTISRDYTLCWRVLFDRRHHREGGLTEVFGIYERI